MIKTSIIVPIYNTAVYLNDCFESIYSQTQDEIEVIAINDGSTDESLKVLKEIQQKHPDMRIYSQENKGLGSARNKGIELARGEYIYFLDSDDCLTDMAMSVCYQYCQEFQLDIAMFDAEVFGKISNSRNPYDRTGIITDQNIVLSGEAFANKYWWNTFCPSVCLLYTSARFIKKNRLLFVPNIYYEDNEFYCKLLPLAERVMYIPQALYRRRYREGSITTSVFSMRHAQSLLQMIQAVCKQKHSIVMQAVVKNLEINFLSSLLENCENNISILNHHFIKELYGMVNDICGNDIESIDTYHDIKLWDQMTNIDYDQIIPFQIKNKIRKRTSEILEQAFSGIPLHLANKYIGIYGTGRYTTHFIETYERNVGDIRAKMVFIDSSIKTGEKKYRNCNIMNIDDIENLPLYCIVIASVKYEKEIYNIIRKKYGNKFVIVCLRSDLQF